MKANYTFPPKIKFTSDSPVEKPVALCSQTYLLRYSYEVWIKKKKKTCPKKIVSLLLAG